MLRQRELLEEQVERERWSLTRMDNTRDRGGDRGHGRESEGGVEERNLRARIAESEAKLRELPFDTPIKD